MLNYLGEVLLLLICNRITFQAQKMELGILSFLYYNHQEQTVLLCKIKHIVI